MARQSGEAMLRLRVALCFFFVCATFLAACAGEPILEPGHAEKIKEVLGYALAPTYLPKGFKYDPGIDNCDPVSIIGDTSTVTQMYTKAVLGKQSVWIGMMYPSIAGKSNFTMETLGLEVPEDAISEMDINGITAYLFHGNWSNDTINQIARAEVPDNPKWDYNNIISIRFAIDVPDYGRVWVSLRTVMPTDEVNDKDLVRIARSVVVLK